MVLIVLHALISMQMWMTHLLFAYIFRMYNNMQRSKFGIENVSTYFLLCY